MKNYASITFRSNCNYDNSIYCFQSLTFSLDSHEYAVHKYKYFEQNKVKLVCITLLTPDYQDRNATGPDVPVSLAPDPSSQMCHPILIKTVSIQF